METRREREVHELRSAIIQQSWKIIEEEGWQALSIRKIADAVEYSVPVIYKHFENKESILEYFSKEGYRLLFQKLKNDTKTLDDPSDKLRSLASSYWQFAAHYTAHYRIMFGLGLPTCQTINSSREMSETSKLMYDVIVQIIMESQGFVTDAHMKLRTFWSTLHGFVAIELLSEAKMSEQASASVLDAIEGFIYTLKHRK